MDLSNHGFPRLEWSGSDKTTAHKAVFVDQDVGRKFVSVESVADVARRIEEDGIVEMLALNGAADFLLDAVEIDDGFVVTVLVVGMIVVVGLIQLGNGVPATFVRFLKINESGVIVAMPIAAVECDPHYDEIIWLSLGKFHQIWHFEGAGRAPGGPEVEDHDAAAEF